jgi:hypothetical protein
MEAEPLDAAAECRHGSGSVQAVEVALAELRIIDVAGKQYVGGYEDFVTDSDSGPLEAAARFEPVKLVQQEFLNTLKPVPNRVSCEGVARRAMASPELALQS